MAHEEDIPQTSPEDDAVLAEWHQKRFLEANRPKRTNAQILHDIVNDPNHKRAIHLHDDGTNRS